MAATITSNFATISGAKIHYLSAGEADAPVVLFLHGASFRAETWEDTESLAFFAEHGYHAVAVSLPGYGQSESLAGDGQLFLLDVLDVLKLSKPVLVSPSMSGRYSLPVVVSYRERLAGFVAVAPVGIPQYEARLKGNPLPTLGIWGDNDNIVSPTHAESLVAAMPNAQKVILSGAGHASYMRETDAFHDHLLAFVKQCFKQA